MAAKKSSTSSKGLATKLRFSVELGAGDLSDEEIESVGNAITKAIVGSARKRRVSAITKDEPFAKIIHAKQTFLKSVSHL